MLQEILNSWKKELKNIYLKEEIESIFFLCLNNFYNLSKVDYLMNRTNNQNINLEETLYFLKKNKPIQYILQKTHFMGNDFFVNERTLIPRPETEELINWIISDYHNGKEKIKILDIGTGSGIIAIILALNLNSEVWALDFSEKALDVAKKNSKSLNAKINFLHKDILNDNISDIFDIVVSNPPYIMNKEKELMRKNILDFEPHLALFVEDKNPLIFYDTIAKKCETILKEKGSLYFEINENLSKENYSSLNKFNFKNIEIKKDIYGKDRMIKGKKL